MSYSEMHEKISNNPKFLELVSKRSRLAITLSLIVLVPYYTFMMITAFNPALLATPIGEGSVLTIGWPIAAVIIVGSWLLTGLYVRRANSEFDELNAQVLKESLK